MSRYKRSSADVIGWPADPEARAAIEQWFAATSDSSYLSGDFLDFRGADLSRLHLAGAYLVGACLTGVRCEDADLGDANLSNADLRGADFSFADLTKADLTGCSAQQVRFHGTRLFAAQLDEADLTGADLRHSVLNSAKLYRTDLRGADLRFAAMRWCTLGGRNMPALLTGARMAGVQLEGAKGGVVGPVFVDEAATTSLDGGELESWFSERGAERIQVIDAA